MQRADMRVPLFPTDDHVAELEATLQGQGDEPEPGTLTQLAWALRQRNAARAWQLVDQAGARGAEDLRLELVRADVLWMQGQLEEAKRRAQDLLQRFEAAGDAIGQGDALWLLALIARDGGGSAGPLLVQAEACYARTEDALRCRLVQLRRFSDSGPVYAEDAWEQWQAFEDAALDREAPAARSWHQFIESAIQGLRGNLAESIAAGLRAYHASVETGQLRSAIYCATNVSIFCERLNDLESALDWARRGLDLAQQLRSKLMQAQALCLLGHVLLRLHRFEAARPLLEESLRHSVPGSGQHANATSSLGQLALAMGDADAAYRRFGEAVASTAGLPTAKALMQSELAKAALMLGLIEEAHGLCDALLRHSRESENIPRLVELLLLKVRILQRERRDHDLPIGAGQTPIACLQEALRLAESTPGMLVSHELLDAIAEEQAFLGDLAQAYAFAQRARQAVETIRSRQANDRAFAMQVQHETERLRLEAEHQRELGLRERHRSEQLDHANATLERLGVIGREITAAHDEREVVQAIERHANGLLDAAAIGVFLVDEPSQILTLRLGREADRDLAPLSFPLDDPEPWIALCARERREWLLGGNSGPELLLPGTRPAASQMLAPLQVGDRLVGMLAIQSPRPQAYGDREQAILRSLCAYGAIALVNARALAALKAAQGRLVQRNAELARIAATDALTGLPNRRQLDLALKRELALSRRKGTPFSLLMLDIDGFKQINDGHGHLVGDIVLESVGQWLAERVRSSDIPGRWGGEEFLVIFPDTDLDRALLVAESLRVSFGQREHAHVGRCTASLGVACYRAGDVAESLTGRADRALYVAKMAGRNRVGVDRGQGHGPVVLNAPE